MSETAHIDKKQKIVGDTIVAVTIKLVESESKTTIDLDTDMLIWLNRFKFDFNSQDERGNTILHEICSCENINLNQLESILKQPKINLHLFNKMDFSILDYLFLGKKFNNCHEKAFQLLKQYNININLQDKDGYAILQTLIYQDNVNLDKIKLLLENSVDVNIVNKNIGHKTPIMSGLEKHPDNIELLKLFIYYKADLNMQDTDGNTILHQLCFKRRRDENIVKLLLNNGANLNIFNNKNLTPLQFLFDFKMVDVDMFSMFLKYGANVNIQDNNGNTILHRFLSYSCTEFSSAMISQIKLLLEHNANPNITNNEKQSILHFFFTASSTECTQFHIDALNLLLEYKADVNLIDSKNNSILDCVVKYNKHFNDFSSKFLGILFNHGADYIRTFQLYTRLIPVNVLLWTFKNFIKTDEDIQNFFEKCDFSKSQLQKILIIFLTKSQQDYKINNRICKDFGKILLDKIKEYHC